MARSVTSRCAGAHVRQLSWPAPAQVSHDSWHGQHTPLWFGKLRGGHRLTHVLRNTNETLSNGSIQMAPNVPNFKFTLIQGVYFTNVCKDQVVNNVYIITITTINCHRIWKLYLDYTHMYNFSFQGWAILNVQCGSSLKAKV